MVSHLNMTKDIFTFPISRKIGNVVYQVLYLFINYVVVIGRHYAENGKDVE